MKNEIHIQVYVSPVGKLLIGSFKGKICLCDWAERKHRERTDVRLCRMLGAEYVMKEDKTIKKAVKQLEAYFTFRRKEFDLPFYLAGTDFQRAVWEGLTTIPYGKTTSYGRLAKDIGKGRAVRAVAAAVGANPLSIILPCHRVVGSDNKLVGYGGGLRTKEFLLRLEQGEMELPFIETRAPRRFQRDKKTKITCR